MKKLLVVMMWAVSLGAMEQDLLQQQQQPQEEMVTVTFGDESSQEVARKYVLLSSVLKNQLEDTNGNTVLIPGEYESEFKLLRAYLPKLYELQQASSDQDREPLRNELKALLTRNQPKELVVTNDQLGMIANMADYLGIEFMPEIILEVCRDRLMSDTNIKNQFFIDPSPKAFNPFGLNDTLLVYLKEKLPLLFVGLSKLEGHTGSVNSVAWSLDGRMLASGSNDKTIKLWQQQQDGQWLNVQTLTGHKGTVNSVAWSPDGTTLASGSDDNTVKLWRVQNNQFEHVQTLEGLTNSVQSVAFSHDGTLLASASSYDPTVKVWKVQNNQWQKVQDLPHSVVESVAWSKDGMLASGSVDGSVQVWKFQNNQWENVQTLPGDIKKIVHSVAWSPDGSTLASGGDQGINLWQLQGVKIQELPGRSVQSVAFNPVAYDRTLASGDWDDRIVKLWQVKDNQWKSVLTFPTDTGNITSVAWSPDGTTLASGSRDKTIKLWKKIPISDMSFPQALLLAYAYQDVMSDKRILDIANYPTLRPLYQSFGHIGGEGKSKDLFDEIKPLIIDTDPQQQQTSTVTGLIGTAASSNNNNTTNN